MTWPTVPIVTTAMDAGTDTPPRDQIKAMADAINDMIATPPAAGVGRLLGVQKFLTAGSFTYTPTAGATRLVIELRGGGGSGAGTVATAAGQAAFGGPGGAGAFLSALVDIDFSSASIVVGAGGAGVAAGANGLPGAATTMTLGSTGRFADVDGGAGGVCGSVVSSFPSAAVLGGAGGSTAALNSPLPSDVVIAAVSGGRGGNSVAFSASFCSISAGGAPFRFPGAIVDYTSTNGPGNSTSTAGSGGGGRGFANCQSSVARANSSPGAGGSVIIWEYA